MYLLILYSDVRPSKGKHGVETGGDERRGAAGSNGFRYEGKARVVPGAVRVGDQRRYKQRRVASGKGGHVSGGGGHEAAGMERGAGTGFREEEVAELQEGDQMLARGEPEEHDGLSRGKGCREGVSGGEREKFIFMVSFWYSGILWYYCITYNIHIVLGYTSSPPEAPPQPQSPPNTPILTFKWKLRY